MRLSTLFVLFLAAIGCQSERSTADQPVVSGFVSEIETAHLKNDFLTKKVVQFDLVLRFGGNERLNGTISMTPDTKQIKIEHADGRTLWVDGDQVWRNPDTTAYPGARFDAFTWTYFFALPYKLSDPGTLWEDLGQLPLSGNEFDAQRLSFEGNIGDSPDDWYLVYADPATHLAKAAAYIVTYGDKTAEEGEADPHAIVYGDYKTVAGIPLAHSWTFWGWTEADGLTNQLGDAELTNFRFIEPSSNFFQAPAGALSIKAPK